MDDKTFFLKMVQLYFKLHIYNKYSTYRHTQAFVLVRPAQLIMQMTHTSPLIR